MLNKTQWFCLLGLLTWVSMTHAVPTASMSMSYVKNGDGTFTYTFSLKNNGPIISPSLTTPTPHNITDGQTGNQYNASNKTLDDDANIVLFGIDTLNDDVEVSRISNGIVYPRRPCRQCILNSSGKKQHHANDNNDYDTQPRHYFPRWPTSAFNGGVETSFQDSDNDGAFNTVIGWHLPFDGFDLNQTIQPGKSLHQVKFTLNKEVTQFQFWIGGSDETNIWNVGNTMLEDAYGIFDADQNDGTYLATFATFTVQARKRGFNYRPY